MSIHDYRSSTNSSVHRMALRTKLHLSRYEQQHEHRVWSLITVHDLICALEYVPMYCACKAGVRLACMTIESKVAWLCLAQLNTDQAQHEFCWEHADLQDKLDASATYFCTTCR